MNDADSAADTSTSDSSSAIENFDFSKPDGGLSETDQQQGAEGSGDATTDEANRQGDAVEQTEEEKQQQTAQSSENADDVSKLTPEERNNQAAQRRIAAREAGQKADTAFLGQLRDEVRGEYIDIDPEEGVFDDMDPQVADQLRQLRQNERAREAERAIERIGAVRDQTRLGVLQAESSIPMFNEADPAYNQKLHNIALSNYAHRYLEVRPGPDGEPQVVGTKDGAPSPLEYLQEQAQEFEEVLKAERLSGQMTAQRNGARADTGSSNGFNQNGSSIDAIESRIGDMPLDKI